MSEAIERRRKKRRALRRAQAEAEFERQARHGVMESYSILLHHYIIDGMRSLMERSPRAARIGVVFGAVMFVFTLLWLFL